MNQTQHNVPEKTSRKEARRLNRCLTQLESIGELAKVTPPNNGTVLISALMPDAIRARGKVEPHLFFPAFCERLASKGYRTEFVFFADELIEKSRQGSCCIIHLYNEERTVPPVGLCEEADANADFVFNAPKIGAIIGNKEKTNSFLVGQGIRMPSTRISGHSKVFSNEVDKTSKSAFVVSGDEIDDNRYNTEFIDTRAPFEGEDYYTTVRLLTVGKQIVHAFIGARNANANKPTVHGVNTPVNGPLIQHFFDTQFVANKERMLDLTKRLDKALGPGFYHHDLMIETGTNDIYLCETGYKFDAYAYGSRLSSLKKEAPCLAPFFGTEFAYRSADAVIENWKC